MGAGRAINETRGSIPRSKPVGAAPARPPRKTNSSPLYVQRPTAGDCLRESSNWIYGGVCISLVAVVVVLAVLLNNSTTALAAEKRKHHGGAPPSSAPVRRLAGCALR